MLHVKHFEENQEKRRYKRRNPDVPECSRCEAKPPLPGQRYCRECKNAAARRHYLRRKEEARKFREMLDRADSVDVKKQMGSLRRRVLRAAT